jgi:hypothetical protein
MCPEEETYKKFAKVRRGYSSQQERTHTHIELGSCKPERIAKLIPGGTCASEAETEKVLQLMFFTLYTVIGKVQLRNVEAPYDPPVFYVDKLTLQFQLESTQYRDDIYFAQYNYVETVDSRVNFLASPDTYQFVDFTKETSWSGGPFTTSRTIGYYGENFYK